MPKVVNKSEQSSVKMDPESISEMHLPPENYKEKEYHHRIRKVLAYIQENLSIDISLIKMAEVANFSPFHFQRLFKQFVGETPKQYILRLCLEKIAHHLKLFPEVSIYEISLQSGFSSHSTFARAFKNYYGVTPEAFRKMSHSDISKICTSKNKISKEYITHSSEFWGVNNNENEWNASAHGRKIEVVKLRSLKVAFIDSHLGNDNAVSNAFRTLIQIVGPRDLVLSETRYIGIFLDLPFFTELNKCRFRACITLPANILIPKELSTCEIPENRYASYTLKGSLDDLLKSLVSFKHQWLDISGYQISETIGYEEYLTNPISNAYKLLQRNVFIPIKPA